ncbi:MAG: hypothetical protein E5X49_21145 [Mesorhizobium sp.]|uniref:hypothetical protein n=1 Tax=Mesorhizobium sp. TaxID=1871066 RepID=UPI001220C84C|nr:hypothetical protein [Mesorhizobium sp.]TIQ40905.1 MAG: hypothetical protein E5X49_21145 [Mesorhizobium sp.]
MLLQKDEVLDRLATVGNVAQFVALRPSSGALEQSYSRIAGYSPNSRFETIDEALAKLIARSGEGKLNVRSYRPHDPRSREFVYGLENIDDVLGHANRLAAEGLHLIVNETIDIHDGGVSGVLQGDTVEFAPDDTPRCVEKPGVASLPFTQAMEILSTVYGFTPDLRPAAGERTEFSVHPLKRGWQQAHTLLWEHEKDVPNATTAAQRWPNHFSRFLGDKTFGLLMAQTLGMAVPRTMVINRRIAPFVFGTPTGSAEVWTRTCPTEPHPGLYTTVKGWTDPFALLANEDPEGNMIASVLRQDAVPAAHSGAAIVDADGNLVIEGRSGEGDRLMLGIDRPEILPASVTEGVQLIYGMLRDTLGPVKFEWVHDGKRVWVVQLHRGATSSSATTIVPGEPRIWTDFKIEDGLDRLRVLLDQLPPDAGVSVIGEVGLTSHIADVLRRAGMPARLPAR